MGERIVLSFRTKHNQRLYSIHVYLYVHQWGCDVASLAEERDLHSQLR